jgi:hypothetical protein
MRSGLVTLAVLLAAAHAEAQSLTWQDRAFVNINFGYQAGSSEFDDSGTFPLYLETGTFSRRYDIESGALFDLSGGVRVWRNLAIVLGWSRFTDGDETPISAEVPHPLFFDLPRSVTASTGRLENSQSAIHVHALWMFPMAENFDLAVFAGPTFFNVKQDIASVGAGSFSEVGPPFTSVNVSNVTVTEREDSTAGFTIGADAAYMFTPMFGAGLFMRYSGGSVDIPRAGGGTAEIDVGGFQLGVGARVRFRGLP